MARRVAVLGGSGLLGSWLCQEYRDREVLATGLSRLEGGLTGLDLADGRALSGLIREFRPDLVFLTAALTSPADCQARPGRAWAVNAAPVGLLAGLARRQGFRLVFISSDLVFNGRRGGYVEADAPRPLSLYGRTKAAGERLALAPGVDGLAVRTSLIVGSDRDGPAGTLDWMARRIAAGEQVDLFSDEFRSPQAAGELARGLRLLAERAPAGLWHLAGPERLSRFELGRIIARAAGWPLELLRPRRQAEVRVGYPRPRDVSLNVDRAQELLGPERLRPLDQVLARSLAGPL